MSIEEEIFDAEYERTLARLEGRSLVGNFDLDEVRQELRHLQIYEGQDWAGRGELKNAEINAQVTAYLVFLNRQKNLTNPQN